MLNSLSSSILGGEKLSATTPIIKNTIQHGTILKAGVGGDFADIDAALSFLKNETWAASIAMTGTVTTTVGSEIMLGIGTKFLNEVKPNEFIIVGSEYHAVRDIQSDGALRLWAGVETAQTGQTATVKKPTKYTLELLRAEDENTTDVQLDDGLSLVIAGQYSRNKLSSLGVNTIRVNQYTYLEVANLYIESNLPVGIFSMDFADSFLGRGHSIFKMHDVVVDNNNLGGIAFIYGSSIDFKNVHGKNFQMNVGGDFTDLTNVHNHHMANGEDGWLFNAQGSHMVAYEHNLNNVSCQKLDLQGGVATQTTNIEWNVISENKIFNINDSLFYSQMPSNEPGLVRTRAEQGVYNFTDCFIHGDIADAGDINKQGATEVINLVRTTRLDGTAVRIA